MRLKPSSCGEVPMQFCEPVVKPYLTGQRTIRTAVRLAGAALVLTATFSLSMIAAAPGAAAAASPVESQMATEIIAQVNAERAARGLGPLQDDPFLANLSQTYADGQAEGVNPPGDPYYTYAQDAAYQWFGFGSAAAGTTTPSSTYTLLWMGSTPHRDTLMQNVPAQGVGVGVSCAADGRTWVQIAVGSTVSPDPTYTSNTPSAPVVTKSGTGTSCTSSTTPTSVGSTGLPTAGMAAPPSGSGYWVTDTHGNITTVGGVGSHGGVGNLVLNAPIRHIVSTPDGGGYWLVASDGGTFALGDAGFFGSMGATHLNAPVVDMAPTPTGRGYWLVASDGGVFPFGDARFYGSMGGTRLNAPMVGMAPTPTGRGYWLVASDGGVFAFGDARFYGSTGNIHFAHPSLEPSPHRTGTAT